MSEPRTYQPDPSLQATEEVSSFDLHAFWRTVVRRRWLIMPFFAAVVLITTLATLRQTKIYDAVCTIIIDITAPRVLEKESVQDVVDSGSGSYWYSKEYYETQYKVITSRAVAQRVSDKLQLQSNGGFTEGGKVAAPGSQGFDTVAKLQSNLRIEPVKESRMVRIRYEDPDPRLAALIANAFADAYITDTLSVRNATTQSASEWLEQQLADLERKLEESGKTLFEFKRSHDIVATSWEDRQSMVSQRLTSTNDALSRARVRRAELRARNEAMEAALARVDRGDKDLESLQPVASSQAIQLIKLRYLEAMTDCADLRARYLDGHPKVEACEKKLGVTRTALQAEIRTALEAAGKEYQEVLQTEKNLQALYNDTKSEAFGLNQYERDYLELKRANDNNQRLYEMVLKRLKDTGVASMLQVSNVRVLDRALPAPRPVRPNLLRNLALAILFGLVGGAVLAFAAEYLDRTITSQSQIEETVGLTFLGIVPSIERNRDGSPQDLFVAAAPKSAAAECLRAVRTNLLFMSPEKPLRTIMVTSSGPQEGKTTTATSLAITMAGSGNRVLLVDADMRRPRIHRIFGAPNQAGLSSLILGEGALLDLAKETGIPNLWVLPCGPIPPNPAELLHTAAFQRLLGDMAGAFDRVIIDSPPVGVVADAVVMATQVDGTLMVLKAGKTDRDVARQAVRQLVDVKAPVFGAVLNDLDLSDQKYGQYSYYYQYGYYYGDASKRREESVQAPKA